MPNIPRSHEGDPSAGKKQLDSSRLRVLAWLAALVPLVALAWCSGAGRWTSLAWNTPTAYLEPYANDVLGGLATIKAASEGHARPLAWKIVPQLGAPFDGNWSDWPSIEELQYAFFGILANLFGLFAALNLAVLIAHVLAAVTFFLVARKLDCTNLWAFVAALAFGLAPFIFAQSPHHLTVAYAWHIPLFLLVWRWVSEEPGLPFGSRHFRWALAIAFVTGLQHIYYTNIFCQLTLLGAGVVAARTRSWAPLRSGLAIVAAAAAAFALMNVDTWSFNAVHGRNPGALVREYKWLEIYGLKLVDLVIPPVTHQSQMFSGFAAAHRAAAPLQDEGSYLGLVGLAALGLLVTTAVIDVVKRRADAVPMAAWQVLWIVLCFSTGGFNTILGALGFTLFRTGCRYSIVILAIVLLYAAQRLTAWQRTAASRTAADTLWIGTLTAAAAFCIAILWDQVPRAPAVDVTAAIASQVAADRDYVDRMEAALPPGAMVFQLPIMDYPESPSPGMGSCDHLRPYLYSRQLRFSFGSMKGRPREQWQQDLGKMPFDKAVEQIQDRGFAAISINRNGFPDKGKQLLENIRGQGFTKPPIESAAGDLVCIPLEKN